MAVDAQMLQAVVETADVGSAFQTTGKIKMLQVVFGGGERSKQPYKMNEVQYLMFLGAKRRPMKKKTK